MDTNLIFEIICPPISWNKNKKENFINKVSSIMYTNNLKYINLPQIIDESRENTRTFNYTPKVENYIFAKELTQYCKTNFNLDIHPIINVVVPIIPKAKFIDYFKKIYDLGFDTFLLIGKDKSNIQYPGYEVTEASHILKDYFNNIKIGGITIFHRENEIKRIINKINHGMEFLVSQIIYNTSELEKIIENLHLYNIKTKIFVSIAPVTNTKEIEFLKWLGVNLNNINFNHDIQNSSIEMIKNIILNISEINLSNLKLNKDITLGFNVEHITYNNLELSEKIIKIIKLKLENLKLLSSKISNLK